MKKQFAALHWTYNKLSQQQDQDESDISWKLSLLMII